MIVCPFLYFWTDCLIITEGLFLGKLLQWINQSQVPDFMFFNFLLTLISALLRYSWQYFLFYFFIYEKSTHVDSLHHSWHCRCLCRFTFITTQLLLSFFKISLFIWLWLVFVAARGLSLVVMHGPLNAVASLIAEHRL